MAQPPSMLKKKRILFNQSIHNGCTDVSDDSNQSEISTSSDMKALDLEKS